MLTSVYDDTSIGTQVLIVAADAVAPLSTLTFREHASFPNLPLSLLVNAD